MLELEPSWPVEVDAMGEDIIRGLLDAVKLELLEVLRDNGRKVDAVHRRVDEVERDMAAVRGVVDTVHKHNSLLLGDGEKPPLAYSVAQLGERIAKVEGERVEEAKGRRQSRAAVITQLTVSATAIVVALLAMCGDHL